MIKYIASFIIALSFVVIAPTVLATNGISGSDSWENPQVVERPASDITFRAAVANDSFTATDIQALEKILSQQMKDYKEEISISYTGSTSHLKEELQLLLKKIVDEDPYFGGTVSTWNFRYSGYENDVLIHFTFSYLTNKEQEEFVNKEVNRVLESLIDSDMTDFEKVKVVNDFIVLQTSYSEDTVASPHSAYALLTEKKGVCQGYALLAYKMLNQLGIEMHYVTGDAGGIGHAWNLVEIEGKWYYLDTTWNDPLPNQKDQVRYTYFLVSGEQLKKDHRWDDSMYPDANSLDFSFMHEIVSAFTSGDMIYYSSELDGDKLYKMNLKTYEKTKLSDNRAYYVTVFGEWIYFSNYSNGARLTKIKKDGTNQTELNQTISTDLYLESARLYFEKNDGSVHSIELETPLVIDLQKYDLWEEKRTDNRKKEWLIEFNAALDIQSVHEESVYIVNSEGRRVSTIQPFIENEKNIRLQNMGEFESNTLYYIVIEGQMVTSTTGEKLTKGIYMPFIVNGI